MDGYESRHEIDLDLDMRSEEGAGGKSETQVSAFCRWKNGCTITVYSGSPEMCVFGFQHVECQMLFFYIEEKTGRSIYKSGTQSRT